MSFAYAICNAGSEPALLAEVARLCPGATPAYRRKGLLTFKLGPEVQLPELIFARLHGTSLGLARDAGDALAFVAPLEVPPRLHVFSRDASVPEAAAIEHDLRREGRFVESVVAAAGDTVIDVVLGPNEPLLVGQRTQGEGWRVPGGRPSISAPEDAPSRAFIKLEEALAWSGLAIKRGETAVELGSAPGGAAYALLRRGVHVIAIDPATLAPEVLAFRGPGGARVRHLQREAGALRRGDIDEHASLLLCDMNLAPPVALRAVTSVAAWIRPSLRAAILTLKLNDARMVDAIPELLARVQALGLVVRATQLPSNRREICVVAQRP